MHLAVVGTGYVGLVTAACFAELGHAVIGVDIDEEKIRKLKQGISPIYEPGLEEVIKRGLESGRLSFTTDLKEALPHCTVLFSAVATPPNEDYTADLRAVFKVCETAAELSDHDIVFINKSTVPVGTGHECEERMKVILQKRGINIRMPVVSNPEFLREGSAVRDTMNPDRIIVGINSSSAEASDSKAKANDEWAIKLIEELYQPLTRTGKPLLFMRRESAEIVKYASNAFLATKISFINMMSEFCEATNANVRDVAKGLGMDERIGPRFLQAGIGYGGSCFPKDVKALMAMSKHMNVPLPIVEAVHDINDRQRLRFFQKLLNQLPEKSTVGVWGLSFKPKTDDMREAPSLDLIPMLVQAGHAVQVFDPVAMDNAKALLPETVQFLKSPLEAAKNAHAVILLTEWDVFRGVDLRELKASMKGDLLFDGRNIYDPKEVHEVGLTYQGIGISLKNA